MARKVHGHKRSNEDIKTPQNSQELRVETLKIHYQKGELPYSNKVENECSKNNSYSNLDSVRKLINEELSKQTGARNNTPNLVARLMGLDMMPLDPKSVINKSYSNVSSVRKLMNDELSKQSGTRNNAPNVVARLMGLDMMPLETKSIVLSDQSISENMEKKIAKKRMNGRCSSSFNSSSRMEFGSSDHDIEEELQKFKRELEAYQAAQENLKKEMVHNGYTMDSIAATEKEPFPSRIRTQSREFEESLLMKPTQITILKCGSDRICDCDYEENCIGSSTLQSRNSMENFLEEVRERLISELQGKTVTKGYTVNAQANLFRSASTRSYKSETELNGPSSPEFINQGTRRFLSERLRNVVKSEVHFETSEVNCWNLNHQVRLKQAEDTIKCSIDMSHCRILNNEKESQSGSFRHEPDDSTLLQRDLSPKNLVRSLSAPLSGTSFRRFPLEDRLILRKLEDVETTHADVKMQKKHRLNNFKEKISNIKHRFGLRGKLLVKKIQSMVESHGDRDVIMMRDIRSGPTVLMKHAERHENSTEVPPSPASLCSSFEEYLSPISTPGASSIEDNVMAEVNRDISSDLNVLAEELESYDPEELEMKPESMEYELVQLEDLAESYARDLLVASGLYFGSFEKLLSIDDTFNTKVINNSVFEQVKEHHKKYFFKENENKLEHKILVDLLNEALAIILGPTLTMSRFRINLNKFYMETPPCGKELLKLVWDIINVSLYPPSNSSYYLLDNVVTRDLGSISWNGLIHDQINVFEREIACLIIDDLVEELIMDMCSSYILNLDKNLNF